MHKSCPISLIVLEGLQQSEPDMQVLRETSSGDGCGQVEVPHAPLGVGEVQLGGTCYVFAYLLGSSQMLYQNLLPPSNGYLRHPRICLCTLKPIE